MGWSRMNEWRPHPGPWWTVAVVLAAVLILDGRGNSQDNGVAGSKLVLRDTGGKERIVLDADGALLQVLRPDGTPGVSMYADKNVAGFSVQDSTGRTRVRIRENPNGTAVVEMRDAKGKNRVVLSADEDGACVVGVTDRTGLSGVAVGCHADGQLGIWFLRDVQSRMELTLNPGDGAATASIKDVEGKVIWQAPPK